MLFLYKILFEKLDDSENYLRNEKLFAVFIRHFDRFSNALKF